MKDSIPAWEGLDLSMTTDMSRVVAPNGYSIGRGAGKGHGTGTLYLNGKKLGRIVDGEYQFDDVAVLAGDVITFSPDAPEKTDQV